MRLSMKTRKTKQKKQSEEDAENKNKSNKLLVFKKYTKREIRNQRKTIACVIIFGNYFVIFVVHSRFFFVPLLGALGTVCPKVLLISFR